MPTTSRITFEEPPAQDDPSTITTDEIVTALRRRSGRWAIVVKADRAARAAATAEKITAGKLYGEGFEAVARQVGAEHRVYARFVG